MAEVIFENVFKRFDDVEVIRDLSCRFMDKEFVVIVGPSGCGKSTSLRMIAGLESITEGTIRIGDRVVNDVPPKDRDIAMVFQNYALYPHMNVYKNMAFGLKLRKFPKEEIDRRVKYAAKILGIEELLNRKPKQLSGGQRQRVAVGRAIVREPSVFLFDEPLSNLDAKLRVQMRSEIKKLHMQLQATMVYVTHDQVEAMTMGDRIIILKDGILQQAGPPMEIYRKPVNQFVAGFIGSPSMNFLPLKVRADNGSVHLVNADVDINLGAKAGDIYDVASGQEIVFGIRPEDMWTGETPAQVTNQTGTLTGHVELVETTGSESLVHVIIAQTKAVARISSDQVVSAGDTVEFSINLEKSHVFSSESDGRSLRRKP